MRVLLHADPVAHRIPGGIGTYVTKLVDGLLALPGAPALELLVARSAGALPDRWGHLPVRRAPLPLRPLYVAWNGLRLPRSGRGADVVHATNLVLPPGAGSLVATVHDLNVVRHPELVPQPWRAIYARGLALAASSAAVLCTSTQANVDALQERYGVPADRVALTPFGPGLGPDDPRDDGAPARLGARRPYVLAVGTLEPRKNLPVLVRAFAAAALPDHLLVLAGAPGWGADEVHAAVAATGVGDRVVVTGGVRPEELAGLYAGADAFAIPSRYEGFGLPLLEALAFGVPAVSSTDPALVEVGGGAALAVDPDDVDALAGALRQLVVDRGQRDRMVAAGLAKAGQASWARTAEATLEAYRRAAAG